MTACATPVLWDDIVFQDSLMTLRCRKSLATDLEREQDFAGGKGGR